MLKISEIEKSGEAVTLCLEGRVVGRWVEELRRSCEGLLGNGYRLYVQMDEVSFVDRDGVTLLRELMGRRVELVGCTPFLNEQLGADGSWRKL